ncbi:SAM-dependent methyltransferase [Aneurinibacillus migulanus]|uniref:class I SAM-dependent methyltransferase n=1 Tax=Aneurinibacillus migulanus TaxID=47500 RepID=UPI0006B497BD|nr:class I SAM-dependent methyltransferase [Aneurinibacillus migulanus]KPD05541.1 SAM-dependent methyltransferase [Aneurinibacillus migulanus]MCP1358914.1 class I SAM-dependent methyltransferase [Aneurinibacillus migulanus]MED4728571.1 class I SAM-dependent methyltransferase [Aneurinibacillus migulanus]
MDINIYNSLAWNKNVESGNIWTKPVDNRVIEKAKNGEWEIILTPTRPVPKEWFPTLRGLKVLCLASGGGQQGPILAAAGAEVTVLDISEKQLEQDKYVAKREHLDIKTVKGSMADLSVFNDESFDFIVHPASNLFIENILPVWKEAYRVLKYGGTLISGFVNPILFIFDVESEEKGLLEVKYSIPYSDLSDLPKERLEEHIAANQALEFGHSLENQIQGQIDAGFLITGFYEDNMGGQSLLDNYINTCIATRAVKLNI